MPNQESFFWAGLHVGDAVLSPYDSEEFGYFNELLLLRDPYREGVLPTDWPSASSLAVSNPAGTTVRVAPGAALVGRHLYINDANIDFSPAVIGHYSVMLTANYTNKKVRAELVGPGASFPPEPIHTIINGVVSIWQIRIATFYYSGSAVIITDTRRFIRNFIPVSRLGNSSANWNTIGTTVYPIYNMKWEFGSAVISGTTINVTFPRAFTGVPLVIVTLAAYSGGTATCAKVYVSALSTSGFSVTLDAVGNAQALNWWAFGPRA